MVRAVQALLTDVGECSDSIIDALSGLHALILECNHDADLLQSGRYPAFLKQRIAGPHGHLSNEQAAGILDRTRSAHARLGGCGASVQQQ